MDNVSVPEATLLIQICNVFNVLITVAFAQEKTHVLFVLIDSSSKMENVLPDVMSDSIFLDLFVKNAKMVALIVKEPDHVLSAKPEDILSMDYAILTALADQLPPQLK